MSTPRQKTCTECEFKGPREKFAQGKRICLTCHGDRVKRSQGRSAAADAADLDIKIPKRKAAPLDKAFDSRDALGAMLKGNLGRAIDESVYLMDFQRARLEQARKMKDAKLINDAANGLDKALTQYTAITTKLMDKLQALEDLRAQEGKIKPVTFYLQPAPAQPRLGVTHTIPPEYYPDGD